MKPPSVARLLGVACLVLLQANCYRWQSAAADVAGPAPTSLGYVRVARSDGTTLRLARARLVGDSVFGRRAGWLTTERVAVPLDSIRTLERRRLDTARTAGAVALWATATGAFFLLSPYY